MSVKWPLYVYHFLVINTLSVVMYESWQLRSNLVFKCFILLKQCSNPHSMEYGSCPVSTAPIVYAIKVAVTNKPRSAGYAVLI